MLKVLRVAAMPESKAPAEAAHAVLKHVLVTLVLLLARLAAVLKGLVGVLLERRHLGFGFLAIAFDAGRAVLLVVGEVVPVVAGGEEVRRYEVCVDFFEEEGFLWGQVVSFCCMHG
jgi:hypothetical protein